MTARVETQVEDAFCGESESLAYRHRALAAALGISPRTLSRKESAGLIPRPVDLGGTKLWIRREISEWIRAGCPPLLKWEQLKKRQLIGSTRR